ncbi:MAG: DNA-binding protein [Gallionellaceae bacterium]|nr:DNA-binding protein [Gallionellaceae bacterium]
MRPVEFTPEEIIAAGEALQVAGRNVTGFALRQRVGGGNPNRLKQVWDEHLASKTATQSEPVAELPVEVAEEVGTVTKALTERISVLAVELNDRAVKAAERRVGEIVRAAGEQREQAERELVDAAQTVDELEARLDEARTGAEALEKRLSEALATGQAQAVELAQLRERLAAAEQSAKSASELHVTEVTRLNAAFEAERARHLQEAEQLRAELAEQKQISKAAVADSDKVRADLAIAKAKIEDDQHEFERLRTDLEATRKAAAVEIDQLRAELATVKATAGAAELTHQEQRKTAAQEAHRVAERLMRAETGRDEAHKEAGQAREEVARLTGQVEAIERQNSALMATLGQQQNETAKPRK